MRNTIPMFQKVWLAWRERQLLLGKPLVFLLTLLALCLAATQAIPAEPNLPSTLGELIFAVRTPGKDPHYYANFGYFAFTPERKAYGDGGKLCRLNLRTGLVTILLDDPRGAVRDPQVHYDCAEDSFLVSSRGRN